MTIANLSSHNIDKSFALDVAVHEEQHQFNALFIPPESRVHFYDSLIESVDSAKNNQELADMVVYYFVKRERQRLMDSHARDEIIAYVREGYGVEGIFSALTTDPLYDYYTQSQAEIARIPDRVNHEVMDDLVGVIRKRQMEGEDMRRFIPKPPFAVESSLIQACIKKVFKEEYKRDLSLWLKSVRELYDKEYSDREIISLLTQEPVCNWPALARRLLPKEWNYA